MREALKLIAAAATEFGSVVTAATETRLELEVCVATLSGREAAFSILAELAGEHSVIARENRTKSQRLPACCPERHINDDGGLCLFWESGDDAVVVGDEQSAMAWWSAVIQHLEGQLHAEKHRRWPGRARAHGGAAEHQAKAEKAAEAFGAEMAKALRKGRLVLIPGEASRYTVGAPVKLMLDGVRVFAKHIGDKRVVNLRSLCPCSYDGRPKILRKCGNHAAEASALIDSLVAQHLEEAEFYARMRGKVVCCGSVDDCPLAKAA